MLLACLTKSILQLTCSTASLAVIAPLQSRLLPLVLLPHGFPADLCAGIVWDRVEGGQCVGMRAKALTGAALGQSVVHHMAQLEGLPSGHPWVGVMMLSDVSCYLLYTVQVQYQTDSGSA